MTFITRFTASNARRSADRTTNQMAFMNVFACAHQRTSRTGDGAVAGSGSGTCTRRELVLNVAMASALVATQGVMPARADRTGRFSTRLTARRRYLPRVRAGVEAVRARGAGDLSVPPVAQTMEDWLPPARLLASGSVGEGAAAAPKRAKLKQTLDELEQYAATADKDPAAMSALLKAIDTYADSIGLDDTLPAS